MTMGRRNAQNKRAVEMFINVVWMFNRPATVYSI